VALRVKGLTTAGAVQLELLAESVATLEQSPARLELARSLTALRSALRRGGRRMDSREPLRRALDIAHRCGATAVENTVRDELIAAGARPRRAAATGADALTVRERRIVEMAAEGLANREIAQRLFVTQRTVETHLHNAFAKLGVRSRHELAGHVPFPGRD
jgi:DNA-binding NarL/FixJ family response regulator